MLNPLFSCGGLQMVMMFLQASFARNNKISGNAGVSAKQIMNKYLKDTLRNLSSDQLGCWSVGTCAEADVTGRTDGDGFLRGVHACGGILHLLFFFCGKTHNDGFFRPLFLATDFFLAREHASDVHLGAFVSQNPKWDRSLGQTLLFKPDASCQSSDTCNTIDNHNTGVSPSSSLTTSWRCNMQPRVCHLCCNAKLVPDWGKTDGVKSESRSVQMAESNVAAVANVLTNPPRTCLCLAASVWQAPKL